MGNRKRVLVVSHGHPDHISGGGEIAAYNLHHEINSTEDFESVFFARHDKPGLRHGGTSFSGTGRPAEILFYSNMSDWFKFSQPDKPLVWRDFREVLEVTKPEIVHFHHYVHLGIEMLREVKSYDPDISIVMTLHEYFGICHNHGQMIKKQNNAFCYESSPAACSNCFPEYSPQDFFLREQFIKSHFDLVDRFISPSEFLVARYHKWGLSEERFEVIENMLRDTSVDNQAKSQPVKSDSEKLKLAYYGQVNWYKGLDLLLEAIELVPEEHRSRITLEVNGSGIEKQDEELRLKIERKIDELDGAVVLNGAYQQSRLDSMMASTDWVIMPSKWWENSPMVILEARKNSTPVICSDIGGMAEKIEHGVTGLHFQARSAVSLTERIVWALENRDQYPKFVKAMKESYDAQQSARAHLRLYRELVEKGTQTANLRVA